MTIVLSVKQRDEKVNKIFRWKMQGQYPLGSAQGMEMSSVGIDLPSGSRRSAWRIYVPLTPPHGDYGWISVMLSFKLIDEGCST